MSSRKVKLGDFLIRSKLPVDIEDNKQYKRVTIRTKHQGVSVRDVEMGSKIGTKKQFILRAGQFVLSKIDAMYGAFGIAPDEVDGAIITGNFWAYDYDKKMVSIEWLNHFTNSPDFYDLCRRASTGITHRKYLDEDFFLNYEVNLPDLNEQENLVVSIDAIRDKASSLENELSHQLTQLENLNQAILLEAVQGKLVPQDKNDEPASELLKRIKAEKAKSGKKEKTLPPIKPEEIPFEIPSTWVWCRLGEAGDLKRGKSKHRPRNDSRLFDGGKFPFIQTGDVSKAKNNNDLITTINGLYNEFGLAQSEIQPKGTLCITIAANIAECGFLDFDACVPDSIVCFQAIDKTIEVYVYHYFKLAKADLERFAPATAQKNINLGILNDLPIPLPPLTEQKRIVAEIEKQLAKTKQLKEHIIANQKATEQLLKALLHQAFEVEKMEEV
jgi:type I restriction enzyme S subunit